MLGSRGRGLPSTGRLEIRAPAAYGTSIGRLHQTIANPGGGQHPDLSRLHGYEESLRSSPAAKGSTTISPKAAKRGSPAADGDNFFAFKYRHKGASKGGKAQSNQSSPYEKDGELREDKSALQNLIQRRRLEQLLDKNTILSEKQRRDMEYEIGLMASQ